MQITWICHFPDKTLDSNLIFIFCSVVSFKQFKVIMDVKIIKTLKKLFFSKSYKMETLDDIKLAEMGNTLLSTDIC